VQFEFMAPGATQATVLGSTDLSVWQVLGAIPLTNDEGLFTNSAARGSTERFYRLRVP
jgi:hypothetical protein